MKRLQKKQNEHTDSLQTRTMGAAESSGEALPLSPTDLPSSPAVSPTVNRFAEYYAVSGDVHPNELTPEQRGAINQFFHRWQEQVFWNKEHSGFRAPNFKNFTNDVNQLKKNGIVLDRRAPGLSDGFVALTLANRVRLEWQPFPLGITGVNLTWEELEKEFSQDQLQALKQFDSQWRARVDGVSVENSFRPPATNADFANAVRIMKDKYGLALEEQEDNDYVAWEQAKNVAREQEWHPAPFERGILGAKGHNHAWRLNFTPAQQEALTHFDAKWGDRVIVGDPSTFAFVPLLTDEFQNDVRNIESKYGLVLDRGEPHSDISPAEVEWSLAGSVNRRWQRIPIGSAPALSLESPSSWADLGHFTNDQIHAMQEFERKWLPQLTVDRASNTFTPLNTAEFARTVHEMRTRHGLVLVENESGAPEGNVEWSREEDVQPSDTRWQPSAAVARAIFRPRAEQKASRKKPSPSQRPKKQLPKRVSSKRRSTTYATKKASSRKLVAHKAPKRKPSRTRKKLPSKPRTSKTSRSSKPNKTSKKRTTKSKKRPTSKSKSRKQKR